MIEPVIATMLLNSPEVAALVADRVYPGAGKENERRARIVLTLLSSTLPQCLDGPAGYRQGTIQAACLATDYRTAHDIAEAVVQAVNTASNSPSPSGLVLHYLEPTDVEDIQAAPFSGQGLPTFGKSVPIDFQHDT
jgi:hypothetical protein